MSTQRFDIRHAPAPRESFRLLYISKSKFGGDWNSTTHTHSCTELFYCLSGEGQFYLAGQLFPVKPDDMVIVNPQVEHTELSLNASPLEYIVLGVASMEFLFSKADTNYAIFNCRENRERMKDAGDVAEDFGDSLEDASSGADKLGSGLSVATVAMGNLISSG